MADSPSSSSSSSAAAATDEAQRASRSTDGVSSSLTSPSACFVHSYLDSAVGAVRKQHQQQQRRSHSRDEAAKRKSRDATAADTSSGDVSTPRESARATPASYFADSHSSSQDEASASAKGEEEDTTASSDGTVSDGGREHRSRQPTHRGPRGAAEPESGHEDGYSSGGNSSYDSDYSSRSEDDRVRSLTRQLAETAVGVREMSKQLGRARVKSTIQSVLIITKARDNHLITLTRELAIWLMTTPRNGRDTGLIVYVDSQLRTSKRFDAEGIRREHPKLFQAAPRHMHSRRASQNGYAATADGVERPASAASTHSGFGGGAALGTSKDEGQLRYWTSDMCSRSPHLFDFVVTLGGDGTVLFCSWLFQRIVPPVMPFALGSLGFLTNFDFAHYADVIKSALDNGIRVNLRMRFTATVYRATLPTSTDADRKRRRAIKSGKTGEIIMRTIADGGWGRIERPLPETGDLRGHFTENEGADSMSPRPAPTEEAAAAAAAKRKDKEVMCFSTRPVETFEVLNDLVVDRGPSPYVSLLEVFGDEHHMTTAQADGLCISTPTGSTAYSLSAGGSLVHPEIPAILISPICPHTLSFRPMLLPDSMELRIAVPYNSRSTAWASFDGRGRVELKQGDHIKVTASRYPFPTVCAENQSIDWFDSISRTLKWNERQRQKSFVVVEEGGGDESPSGRRSKKSSAGASSTPDDAGKAAEAPSSSTPVKPADDALCPDLDDEDDDEDTEETEAFDIDDSSTAAPTRAGTPDPPNMLNGSGKHHSSRPHSLRRRASASGAGRRSSSKGDGQSSSLPGSHRSSHEALPRLGLTPLTPAVAAAATATQRGFEPTRSASRPSSAKAREASEHAREDSHNSLLDSPDRFGLAGPPLPPRAISERHLAHADFRLDDAATSGAAAADAQRTSSPDALSASALQAKARRIAQSETLQGGTLSRAVDVLQGATDAITPRTSPQSQQRARSSRVRDMRAQAGQGGGEEATPRGRRGSAGTTSGGGTALIVYGEDDSDSDEISADQ